MIVQRHVKESVAMTDFPPARHEGQEHGRISAAVEAHEKRYGAILEGIIVIICKVANLVFLGSLILAKIVGRRLNGYAACLLRHVKGFEIGLDLHIAAPHLELADKGLEICLVICLVLDQNVLAAGKGIVNLLGIANADIANVLALRRGDHAQSFHGHAGRRNLSGAPKILAL